MAFGKKESAVWFKIIDGKINIRVKPEQRYNYKEIEDVASLTREVVSKNGDTYIEYQLDYLEARLQNIEKFTSDYGETWTVTFQDTDTGTTYKWSTNYTSSAIQHFVNSLASLDGKYGLLRIDPYAYTYVNKQGGQGHRSYVAIRNNGEKVERKYATKDLPKITEMVNNKGVVIKNSNGMPMYDETERREWLEQEIDKIQNYLSATTQTAPAEAPKPPAERKSGTTKTKTQSEPAVMTEDDDEIPF